MQNMKTMEQAYSQKTGHFIPGKIQEIHHNRLAIIYIRQSTLHQVQHNSESTKLQYALTNKAETLGWISEQIIVIDDDLGRSGANALGRPGFQRLVSEVGLNRVGMILGIEISRLARSCRDWHQLLEICALFRTLIGDSDGIYDPGNYNDRLLLGLKGTMSEAELHILKQRMLAGKIAKAKRGEIYSRLPVGYIRNQNSIAKEPDEQIQSAIELIFKKFEQSQTISGIVKYFNRHKIRLPFREHTGLKKGDLVWRKASQSTIKDILYNPTYAGAYVYGRKPTDPRKKKPGHPSSGKTIAKQNEWQVFIKDHHSAYITWEEYERNQQQLIKNASSKLGVPRPGSALLSGLMICGHCKKRMITKYSNNGAQLRYFCETSNSDDIKVVCQSLVGAPVDKFIEEQVLIAVEPSSLEISLKVAEDVEQEKKRHLKLWQQRLDQARYTMERAYRQYNKVDPENRLVARTLEKNWEEALAAEVVLQKEYEQSLIDYPTGLTEKERESIRQLASDIPALWSARTTTVMQRQQVVRLLIKHIIITVKDNTEKVCIDIQWVGGHKTSAFICRPVAKLEQLSYYPALLDRVADLRKNNKTSDEIATILNNEKWRPFDQNKRFNGAMVIRLLHRNGITGKKKSRTKSIAKNKNETTFQELSQRLDVPSATLYGWMRRGLIRARLDKTSSSRGIWLLDISDKEVEHLKMLREKNDK